MGRSPSSLARETVSWTLEGERLPTQTLKPLEAMFRAKFWPMTARPYRPMSQDMIEGVLIEIIMGLHNCLIKGRSALIR